MSAFALVFQVFYVIRAAFHEKDPQYHGKLRKWSVCALSYYKPTNYLLKRHYPAIDSAICCLFLFCGVVGLRGYLMHIYALLLTSI